MIRLKKYLLFLLLLSTIYTYSQDNNLDFVRRKYCGKNCNIYKKNEEKYLKQIPPPPEPPVSSRKSMFSKLFSIRKNERAALFPFNKYDSIYIIIPNTLKNINEPRDYTQTIFHKNKRLITKNERDKLSDIMFNYFRFNNGSQVGVVSQIGCDCIEWYYPKIILLFFSKGITEKYIALPNDGYFRSNFAENEYYKNLDMSKEKEEMILKLFKKDIDKTVNIPCENTLPLEPIPIPIK